MKTALVVGINGNFGFEMAQALKTQGWNIRALIRDAKKAPAWLSSNQIVIGDAMDIAAVGAIAAHCDLIVYAANPPYHRWHELAMKMLEPTATVAERFGLRVLFPGNVYNFAPQSELINEQTVMQPPTDKGKIRQQMENRLKLASTRGAKVTIVRAGDFIGPNTHFSWLDIILKQHRKAMTLAIPHNDAHVHFWSYLPDLCANTAKLMEQTQDDFEIYHDAGLRLSSQDWQRAFAINNTQLKVKKLPWWLFKLASPFSPLLKEVLKMRYLWQKPVMLDGRRIETVLGPEMQRTSLPEILQGL